MHTAEIRGTSLGTGTQGRTRYTQSCPAGKAPRPVLSNEHVPEMKAQGYGLRTPGIAGNQGFAISSTKYSWKQARVNTETNTVQHLHAGTRCTLPRLEKLIEHRVQLPSRGTWTGGKTELRGSLYCSGKGVQSPAPVREQPQAPA